MPQAACVCGVFPPAALKLGRDSSAFATSAEFPGVHLQLDSKSATCQHSVTNTLHSSSAVFA